MTIPIMYEDGDILVVDKPAGVTVNRAETTKDEMTIQDWSEKHNGITYQESRIKYGEEGWKAEDEFYQRGGVVHRLDKETSGILILAKNPESFVELQKQFRERKVKKVYQALAHGKVPVEGEIDVPVGRIPWNRKQFGILPGGRESTTTYKVLQYYKNPKTKEVLSLVELYPQSGRTHQIRVHLKYIGHPIFSDFLYAGRKTARNDRKNLERVFLHASQISFSHPRTKEQLSFTSQLSAELQELLKTLYTDTV